MQRMIDSPVSLPKCRAGHAARLIHDCRRASAGGGLLIECACSSTSKHAEFTDALREWVAMGVQPSPPVNPRAALAKQMRTMATIHPFRRA